MTEKATRPTEWRTFLEVLRIEAFVIFLAAACFSPLLAVSIFTGNVYATYLMAGFLFAYLPLLMVGIYAWTRKEIQARVNDDIGADNEVKA